MKARVSWLCIAALENAQMSTATDIGLMSAVKWKSYSLCASEVCGRDVCHFVVCHVPYLCEGLSEEDPGTYFASRSIVAC